MSAKSITVVAVTSLAPRSHAIAIERTVACIPHTVQKLLIAPYFPVGFIHGSLPRKPIPDWMPNGKWSLADMCRFLMRGLHEHIDTDVAILVQWDGYAINARKWDDKFLEWDFIGAPWPRHFPFVRAHLNCRVGNGGFSLRSKRWLEASATLPEPPAHMLVSEDVYSSRHADHYAKAGCRVAPLDVAMRFSMEHRIEEHPRWRLADSFGFHGLTDRDPMRKKLRLNPHE